MNIKVTADSTCDLSAQLVEDFSVTTVPLSVVMGGNPFLDGVELTPDEVYAFAEKNGGTCSTTAVNVAAYTELFTGLRREYDAVIHFTISGEMSACYQNAVIAASELQQVYVIDSRSLSTGIGQLVLDAVELARGGMPAAEIVDTLNEKKTRLDVSFVLDTLDYLRRGGRCSAVAALGANLLSLKPCIEVKNGLMGVGKKYRGSVEKSITKYIIDRLDGQDNVDYSRIFITHSGGFTDEYLESVRQEVLGLGDFKNVYITRAGCTVSNHCGPKTLGILFYRTN